MNRREFFLTNGLFLLASAGALDVGSCFGAESDSPQIAKLSALLQSLGHHDQSIHGETVQKIAGELLRVADPQNQPSRQVVGRVADALAAALEGRKCPAQAASQLAGGIVGVLDSVGGSTYDFRQSVNKAKNALLSINVPSSQADAVTRTLTDLGTEIRGPGDMPAKFR
jgi:hypothetical protein